jgi:hypothetical protein
MTLLQPSCFKDSRNYLKKKAYFHGLKPPVGVALIHFVGCTNKLKLKENCKNACD